MTRVFRFSQFCFFGCLLGLLACRDSDPVAETGQVTVQIDNVVGNQDLKLGSTAYTNGVGETFTISKLDYYLTNFRLRRTDGSEAILPQDSSYFLIRESDAASQTLTLRGLPPGDYSEISFLVGVDSLRNTMDIGRRTGVLDPAGGHSAGMYWDWNSGYIHLKLEGTSPSAPTDATGGQNFRYHIGLFGGYQTRTLNNLRTVRVLLGSPVTVATSARPTVVIAADVLQLFNGPTPVSIRQYPEVMVGPFSSTIADNYARIFRFSRLQTNP
ncbi:MbnP family protein [Tellurirhabdus rosea]|uniref:MbnP family protein n=1 Tax=Tellurirhabdus rosea TaxID=2674997 RepID=UPI002252A3BE|nr:MbnP family protein [Tellurirhabdus rosea]